MAGIRINAKVRILIDRVSGAPKCLLDVAGWDLILAARGYIVLSITLVADKTRSTFIVVITVAMAYRTVARSTAAVDEVWQAQVRHETLSVSLLNAVQRSTRRRGLANRATILPRGLTVPHGHRGVFAT